MDTRGFGKEGDLRTSEAIDKGRGILYLCIGLRGARQMELLPQHNFMRTNGECWESLSRMVGGLSYLPYEITWHPVDHNSFGA